MAIKKTVRKTNPKTKKEKATHAQMVMRRKRRDARNLKGGVTKKMSRTSRPKKVTKVKTMGTYNKPKTKITVKKKPTRKYYRKPNKAYSKKLIYKK